MRLGEWASAHQLSFAELGRRLGVTTSEARRFTRGERIPRSVTLRAIYLATGGQVTPNDFYDLPELPDSAETDPPCECRRVA